MVGKPQVLLQAHESRVADVVATLAVSVSMYVGRLVQEDLMGYCTMYARRYESELRGSMMESSLRRRLFSTALAWGDGATCGGDSMASFVSSTMVDVAVFTIALE